MQDFVADAYRDWLQGTAKYTTFAAYKTMNLSNARKFLYQCGLSSRAVEAIVRAFRGRDVNFDLLASNPHDVGLCPIMDVRNCGVATANEIRQWVEESEVEIHKRHFTSIHKKW